MYSNFLLANILQLFLIFRGNSSGTIVQAILSVYKTVGALYKQRNASFYHRQVYQVHSFQLDLVHLFINCFAKKVLVIGQNSSNICLRQWHLQDHFIGFSSVSVCLHVLDNNDILA